MKFHETSLFTADRQHRGIRYVAKPAEKNLRQGFHGKGRVTGGKRTILGRKTTTCPRKIKRHTTGQVKRGWSGRKSVDQQKEKGGKRPNLIRWNEKLGNLREPSITQPEERLNGGSRGRVIAVIERINLN